MKHLIVALLIMTFIGVIETQAQTASNGKEPAEKAAADNSAYVELAKATLAAHGGEKLKQMRTFIVRGSVDITSGPSITLPATFTLTMSGDKYLFEMNNPIQPLKQIFDGQRRYSSGYELPPMTSLGFPLLPKVGDAGYVISAPGEGKKKKKGFRITTPEGYYTDFFVDEKTGQIKTYESAYEIVGRNATTSVEIDEMMVVEGITVPKKYSQRFDLGQITAYGAFKSKEVLINQAVPDDLFTIPK